MQAESALLVASNGSGNDDGSREKDFESRENRKKKIKGLAPYGLTLVDA